jgi:hypothetical protein
MPNVLKRRVYGKRPFQNANGKRTEGDPGKSAVFAEQETA